ncbi:MAG: hypothetical protein LBL81_05800 [Tannerella sp.]|nr:hypothetical protein [Tannerella sp.]
MKIRLFFLAAVFALTEGCYHTAYPPEYFYDTSWTAFETGSVYDPRDSSVVLYSYRYDHLLQLGEGTYVHTIHRQIKTPSSTGYLTQPDSILKGSFTILYPEITFRNGGQTTLGDFIGTTSMEVAPAGSAVLAFTQKTTE